MTAPATWLARAAAVGRAATVVLLALVLARFAWSTGSTLKREIATLAAHDQVIAIRGGDVALRDAPQADDLRSGRVFRDPYYAGEPNWYPFFTPLVVAVVSKLTGGSIPASYFSAEIGFVTLYLLSVGLLAFTCARWAGLLALPVVMWLRWLPPGNGLYPIEAVRGGLLLFLAYAGLAFDRTTLSRRDALGIGLAVGLLGLWNGAAFAVAAALAVALAVHGTIRAFVHHRLGRLAAALGLLLLGAAIPLSLLFGPQLLAHGRLAVPGAARTWMADVYMGGTLAKALHFPLAPRGLLLALALIALARVVAARPLRLPPLPRAVPLLAAYALCLLVAHLGFVIADAAAHPALARAARALLPAPAHTFLAAADACRPVVVALGLVSAAQLAAAVLTRLRAPLPALPAPLLPLGALAAAAVLLVNFPRTLTRFSTADSRAFALFARRTSARTAGRPIFFRYPGRFLQQGSLKILRLSVAEYASPYAHRARIRAEEEIDDALRAGQPARADTLLDRYGIAFIMEDPRAPTDPVIRRCGGPVLDQQDGYRLRARQPCRS